MSSGCAGQPLSYAASVSSTMSSIARRAPRASHDPARSGSCAAMSKSIELERFDRVADANASGLLDLAEDAEVDPILATATSDPAVGADRTQGVEVRPTCLGILRRDRAPVDLLVHADDGLADAHGAPGPV